MLIMLINIFIIFCRISSSLNPSNPIAWNRRRQWRQGTGCGTWQLDITSTSTTADISQTEISCSENRKPLCIKPTDPSLDITFQFLTFAARRRKNKGRSQVKKNKRRQSLRWKQRKNKKSEKVGFTQKRKRQGRSVSQAEARQAGQDCDPIEVRYVIQNM